MELVVSITFELYENTIGTKYEKIVCMFDEATNLYEFSTNVLKMCSLKNSMNV